MSTQPVVEEVKVPLEPPKVFKARREIQPRDKDGNNLGSPHVYEAEGATQAEADQKVADKMADAISNGTLKIRELNLKVKNGGLAAPKIPEGAEVDDFELPEPKPKVLTAEEKFQLANDLKDPAKMEDAYDRLYEARTGFKPQFEGKVRQLEAVNAKKEAALKEVQAFNAAHPEFLRCPENSKAMLDYMAPRGLKWTKSNLEIAYKELASDGLLVTAPKRQEPTSAPGPIRTETVEEVEDEEVPEPVVEPPKVVRQPDRFPSAIRPSAASGGDTKPKPKKPSAKEVAMMNADEYKAYAMANGLWGK